MKREQIQAPKGVSEYVPPRSASFEWVRDQLIGPAKSAGYQLMELPVFEDTNLFSRMQSFFMNDIFMQMHHNNTSLN